MPTPAKYLVAVLFVQAFLAASAHYQWFEFNQEKGYSVVIAFAATSLMLLLLAAWLLASRLFKARAQFSLATLMLMVPIMAIPCAWFAREYQQAQKQRAYVAEALAQGFEVDYDKYLPEDLFPSLSSSGVPKLLVAILGDDFFAVPDDVSHDEEVDDERLAVIRHFAQLKCLQLIEAKVTDAGLAHLEGLTQLELLWVIDSFNSPPKPITDKGLAHLKNLRELQMLDLDRTTISDAGLEHLTECKQLTEIHFRTSQITDDGVAKLVHRHPSLTKLGLNESRLTDAALESLSGLAYLDDLEVSGTAVTDAGLTHLAGHPTLRSLDLSNTNITSFGLAKLGQLPKLEYLYLGETALTDSGLIYLRRCSELRVLDLSRTEVTDDRIENLRKLPKLERLDLSHTAVTDVTLDRLEAFTQLKEIDVYKSNITKEGVERFQEVRPECEVRH